MGQLTGKGESLRHPGPLLVAHCKYALERPAILLGLDSVALDCELKCFSRVSVLTTPTGYSSPPCRISSLHLSVYSPFRIRTASLSSLAA